MISSKKENIAFSPYGLVSVALVLYEGSTGPSAAEIHNTLRLPWDREVTRVGFRDMHRYLKSYFSNDGFLRGLVLSKPNTMLRKNYTDLLQFYGFDVRTSPPRVPTTPVPPVLTTRKPATTTQTPATKKPVMTTEPVKTTTPLTVSQDLDERFGTTTTEIPKQQTILTTFKGPETTLIPQTSTPAFGTTAEKTTKSFVTTAPTTTKLPAPTTTVLPTTTAFPTTTKTPSTTTPPPTTTVPPTTTPSPPKTTTMAPTTTKAAPPITTTIQPPSTTNPPTTKSMDSTQSGTTLDVVTMTDKKPNTPEIMSQVNMSATATTKPTTTIGETPLVEGREGDYDMNLETTKFDTTTKSKPTTMVMETSTPSEATNAPPTQATTLETSNTVQVSIAETTVSKTVSMDDPNTTPMPSTLPQERTTEPKKSEIEPVTLIIETTTPSTTLGEEITFAASETVTSQGTTIMLPEETTIPPEGTPNLTSEDSTTQNVRATTPVTATTSPVVSIQVPLGSTGETLLGTLLPGTVPPVVTAGSPISVGTETTPPVTFVPTIGTPTDTVPPNEAATKTVPLVVVFTESIPTTLTIAVATEPVPRTEIATGTNPPISVANTVVPPLVTVTPVELTTEPAITILPKSLAGYQPLEPLELSDSEASGSQKAEALARQQRSLFSTHKTPEYHKSGSNWVPQYQDHRWGQNPSNEFWFFTFTGGENVPAHTYTAYLPFAFVPELSSLALQLPLDDPRYSILILLPEERLGLSQLLYSLQWCPVRAILTHLKMTAVYAVVPAFTIVKHINLVPALAKMGIHSVFDPFRADMSPMTTEPHLFVRTIEQVVTVSLRKYYASNPWFEASPNEVRQHFVANHPFAYFVLDKETDVTLMAGTIVNPVARNQ